MGNLVDYLRWRGDLRLASHPFNLVDNLVVSALSNVDLSGIVPGPQAGSSISVAEAAEILQQGPPDVHDPRRLVFVPRSLLSEMARTARFGGARLSGYSDLTDVDSGLQFAAVRVHLDDDSMYVAFRGTDTSIAGWREDFVMSFEVMPSQRLAVDYLREAIDSTSRDLLVGGHSKGGNLATFAFLHLSQTERARVRQVFSNDGPGLSPGIATVAGPDRVERQILRISPPFSVVGMLFHDYPPDRIVASSGTGLMQHDIMTWQVEGDELVAEEKLSNRAVEINQAIAAWLNDATDADRRDITETVFDALSAGGAILMQDVGRDEFGGVESVLLSLTRSRGRLRGPARQGLKVVGEAIRSVDYVSWIQEPHPLRLVLTMLAGLFLIAVPDLAVQLVAALGIAGLCTVLGFRAVRYVLRFRQQHRIRWPFLVGVFALVVGLLAATTQVGALIVPGNLLLGLGFLLGAWGSARQGLQLWYALPRRVWRAVLLFANAVVAALFGIVALTTAQLVLPFYVVRAGLYLVVAGLVGLFLSARDRAAATYRQLEVS